MMGQTPAKLSEPRPVLSGMYLAPDRHSAPYDRELMHAVMTCDSERAVKLTEGTSPQKLFDRRGYSAFGSVESIGFSPMQVMMMDRKLASNEVCSLSSVDIESRLPSADTLV